MKSSLLQRSSASLLVAFGLFACSSLQAQSNAVTTAQSGSKVYLEINAQQLRSELDSLMSGLSSLGAGDWNAILTNGSNPGMDVDFSGYDAQGIEDLIATGTVTADSLVLNQDASVTGRMTITGVTTVNDSLKATGYVTFSDTLEVVRAVSVGEALFVTGVTALGDSLHVVGNVDLDAMLNVDGAVTFGASLSVAGVTTMNDSLKVNGDAAIAGTLGLDSLSVTDVINGQVNSLENFTSDALLEGDSNLYFTAAERTLLASLAGVLNTLDSLIAVIDGLNGTSSDAWTCGSPFAYQGYDYATVEIGSQCWFAENVRSTSYNDDVAITSGLDNSAWSTTADGAMTIYDEGGANEAANLTTYGRLYNWHAVNTGKLCPSGWHVPSDEEWTTLTDHLGGEAAAGQKMKASDSDDPAWVGTNSSGFSGLPGGYRHGGNGNFDVGGSNGTWWSSSLTGGNAWLRELNTADANAYRSNNSVTFGLSVRCVQDAAATASVPTVVTSAASDVAEEAATLNGSISSDGGETVTASGFRWGALADLSDAQDLVGSGTSGAFTSNLTGLTAGTTYYYSAFATNAEGTSYGDTLSFETVASSLFTCGTSAVTFDGHDYATVEIGSQCWFAENLRSTKYNDEAVITSGLDNSAWSSTTNGAVTVYDEGGANEAANLADYGRLYNWFAVNTGKLCPTGWHVPADEEWTTLTEHLEGESVAGITMKTAEWGGNNGSGFSALPGGYRHGNGTFNWAGTDGVWWSSTSAGGDIWTRSLWDEGNSLGRNAMGQRNGLSVRCLQDAASTASAPTVVTEAASDVAEETATLNGSISSDGGEVVTASGFRWGALADLSDAQDLVGSGTSGAFTGNLTGLTAGTTYYFTAFATNAGGTAYGDTLSFETAASSLFTCGTSTVTFSGHDYATVEIGSQCWFAENLRSTSYNDDVVIPSGLSNSAWQSTTEGAMTIYGEGGADEETNLATYGRLYNWYGVNTGKLCPSGWHVPSDEEWTTLTGHLGSDAGTRMKASASDSPAWDGTNSSGFSALPGGFRDGGNGFFFNQGADGYWWTSSLDGPNASLIYLTTGNPNFGLASTNQGTGFSVRCVQDAAATASVPTVVTSAASDVAEEAATLNGSITSDGGEVVTASGFRWGALADLSDAQDLAGSGTSGAFTGNLTGLTAGTTYYFSAFATNAEGTSYGDTLSFETVASSLFTCGTSAVTFDGYDYATVEIGAQCWLAENLRSTSFNDDELIPDDVYNEEWTNTTQGATALYNGSEINGATSGRLYNWYAVNSGKLCPVGWKVPTDAEWTTLTDQLGGESVAGELMKSSASDDPSWNGTNSSGFSGLPGGLRDASGPYYQLNTYGYWWSSSSDSDNTWYRRLGSTSDGVHRAIADSPQLGLSVRCIQGTSDR